MQETAASDPQSATSAEPAAVAIPALAPPFIPRRYLANGHLQTLAGNFLPRNIPLPQPESLLIEVEGPVDQYGPTQILSHCPWQPANVRRQRPTVLLIHGLEGSSQSKYIIGNTARALAAGDEAGGLTVPDPEPGGGGGCAAW